MASSRKRDHRLPLLAALVKIAAYYVENGNISSAFREKIILQTKKPQRKFRRGFSVYSKLLLGLGLDLAKRVTVIGQAIFAHPVRQPVSPALGTSHDTGSLQLPNGAAPLIAPGLGHFSLRNRHG